MINHFSMNDMRYFNNQTNRVILYPPDIGRSTHLAFYPLSDGTIIDFFRTFITQMIVIPLSVPSEKIVTHGPVGGRLMNYFLWRCSFFLSSSCWCNHQYLCQGTVIVYPCLNLTGFVSIDHRSVSLPVLLAFSLGNFCRPQSRSSRTNI